MKHHIKPLNPRLAFSHEYAGSDYPDIIKIPMEDGHVITYRRDISQPEPRFVESYEMLRTIERGEGYGYVPKHAKK